MDESRCSRLRALRFDVRLRRDRVEETQKVRKATVRSIMCKGCGTCTAACPVFAIKSAFYGDERSPLQSLAAVTP